jgi:dihydrofolate reductase
MIAGQELKGMFQLAINLIVCMDKKGLIGNGNSLPWKIPEDLTYFRNTTLNQVVIMGRKTFESIPKKLEDRICFIISGNPEFKNNYGTRVWSVNQFLPWAHYYKESFGRDTFVIGGAEIYKQFYHYCDKLYITYVNDNYEGDIYFPISFSQIKDDFEIIDRKITDKCEFIVMGRKYEKN